jgi:hypothetical protein
VVVWGPVDPGIRHQELQSAYLVTVLGYGRSGAATLSQRGLVLPICSLSLLPGLTVSLFKGAGATGLHL